MKVNVLGAGLAGCESAWQLAKHGIEVNLYEMKPHKYSEAHKYGGFAELVCSNSLKAFRLASSKGMLKAEMREFGSICLEAASHCSVPAGGALAVDRELFSDYITKAITNHELITVINEEVTSLQQFEKQPTIIATGPLTSDALAKEVQTLVKVNALSFYDAAAPIVTKESVNMDIAFKASRYDKGDDDYINCPMNKEEYEIFYNELVKAESAPLKEIDTQDFRVYEGCMPIEVLAKRGAEAIRYASLKPVGLRNPNTGHRPWAVLQLRSENAQGELYNLVGFQTNLKFGEQKRVFSLIPGLEKAEFVRYGVMHRNTFIDSPRLLDCRFNFKENTNFYFAGQITGVEGYMESASSGIFAGYSLARKLKGLEEITLPRDSMMGALFHYISDETVEKFQPMAANMGILPSLETKIKNKSDRYEVLANRGLESLKAYLKSKVF